jgi:hypothetical protein
VDLHACAWGQLAALGHSADLMTDRTYFPCIGRRAALLA